MTMQELSAQYAASAQLLSQRLSSLRLEKKRTKDATQRFLLTRRIYALTELLRQTYELTELTAHYYDRGYYRNEVYRI